MRIPRNSNSISYRFFLSRFSIQQLIASRIEIQQKNPIKEEIFTRQVYSDRKGICSAIEQVVTMLKIPDHQVAGHKAIDGNPGPLIDESGLFYKPLQGDKRGANEVTFYENLSSNTKIPEKIRKYFPKSYGTRNIDASDGSGLQPHLVLQDLNFDRINPSIMDVKIGSRTWDPQQPENYIQKCVKKDQETSSLSLGFRLSGMQIYENEKSVWKSDKRSVQSMSADEIKLLLKKFVSSGKIDSEPDCSFASIVYGGKDGILSQLLELKEWFEEQTIYHFYTCSILIMFEKELALDGKNPRPEIKLIDFAHVFEGKGVIDHNFLGGLCSFIKFVSEIISTPDEFATDVGFEEVPKLH